MSTSRKIIISGISLLLIGAAVFAVLKFLSGSSGAHLKVIPSDAAAVLKINTTQLALKADIPSLMKLPAFSSPGSNGSPLGRMISDPMSTGLNPVADVYGFLAKNGQNTVSALVFSVRDAGDLSTFIRSLSVTDVYSKEDDVWFADFNQQRCIAWTDDAGMIVSTDGGDIHAYCKKLLEEGEEQSIIRNKAFASFNDKTFDAGIWLDNHALSTMNTAASALGMMGIGEGTGEVLLSFEDEGIKATYSSDGSYDKNRLLKSGGFSDKKTEVIAPSDPVVMLGLVADIAALMKSLKSDNNMNGNITGMEDLLGINDADIQKLATGEISVAFTGFRDISVYDPRVSAEVKKNIAQSKGAETAGDYALLVPMVYIDLGVTDDSLANSVLDRTGMDRTGRFYAAPGINFIVYAGAKNGHLLITNDYYAEDSLVHTGTLNGKISPGWSSVTSSNSFFALADLDQSHFSPQLDSALADNFGAQELDFYFTVMKPFRDASLCSTGKGSTLTISVGPGSGNSLFRLLSYYGTLAGK
ncbi:MAG TPA: DUF4836 family protein [Bacteroidia bacterium]|nr:DUF4836 family protein [Bacteroidia bacterium]